MGKLILVSNRLPMNLKKGESGYEFTPSIGGLATALSSFHEDHNSIWVGWPGITAEECSSEDIRKIRKGLTERRCRGVFLSSQDIEDYYEGFSNKTIWPLFHYFINHASMEESDWIAYKKVNEKFASEILKVARKGDTIWIHDYHLFLLPHMLRERIPELSIGFFLHIPFPSSEVFRTLPWRNEILKGIMGADLIGFHTYDYVIHFISSVRRLLGYENSLGYIHAGARTVKVRAFPISIDFDHYSKAPASKAVLKEKQQILKMVENRKIIMSIDRMDYTKGIPQRIRAYGRFLEKYPEYHEKVTLINVASPSRIHVDTYQDLKLEVEQLVGEVNGKFTRLGWVPIWYIFQNIPENQLLALYSVSDVALITPLRDGMNLTAKEYIASKSDHSGVLILSELAGAAKELGECLHVNPHNVEDIADAIFKALEMPGEKQVRSNRIMRERIRKYDVDRWASDFVSELKRIKEIQTVKGFSKMDQTVTKSLLKDYRSGNCRLILLDYDGTLIKFSGTPDEAVPDPDLLSILQTLIEREGNELVIVSGRDKDTLERWFGDMDLNIIAEHGVWTKLGKGPWSMIEQLEDSWKDKIRPVLESFVIKTPGAFVEEKGHSLAWHYRKADQNQAQAQISEMKETLHNMISNLNVGILNGNKVIEIKNIGVNKGRAVKKWTEGRDWDFILAVGDDWTDEDMFEVLPEKGYSIRVGYTDSKARFNLRNVDEVRDLIQKIAEVKDAG
ncbi:MAG: bifunctional alpha,alpha-trehalose-phosphate synthase (UDP-forming)/trehalose-phosphatase [Thermoplasmata archaeon]|nr:bifunctional alpha,alpha-trehalose-phosphate synthase (UDP-forming)/trehalose-phosphatase [Thermoplasmata archaeon]